jgi:Tol biopolymer transport system component
MTRMDRRGNGTEHFSAAWRRSTAASSLLVFALAAGGCQHATQGSVTPVTGGESHGTEQMLSIVDVGSGTGTAFTAPVGASEFDITLDGSMVAYSDVDEEGNLQVFVMNVDGSNANQLTHGKGGVGGPSWSPDGSMIAYERDTSDQSQIFVVRVSNGESTIVTHDPRGAVDPGGWAPDGGAIVYSTINTAGDQYTARSLDLTTEQTRLIVADGSTPTLSPDGAHIAFNSWMKPQVRLIVANSDGSGRRIIARFDNDDGYQRWSPDSTQIAYVGTTDEDGYGTYVYDLATGETRFVTDGTVESWIDDDHILVS